MARPQAYDPQEGYKYQIFCRHQSRIWDHCDHAKDRKDKDYLIGEYRLAYGPGWEFKYIILPRKYWPKPERIQNLASENKRHQPYGAGFNSLASQIDAVENGQVVQH